MLWNRVLCIKSRGDQSAALTELLVMPWMHVLHNYDYVSLILLKHDPPWRIYFCLLAHSLENKLPPLIPKLDTPNLKNPQLIPAQAFHNLCTAYLWYWVVGLWLGHMRSRICSLFWNMLLLQETQVRDLRTRLKQGVKIRMELYCCSVWKIQDIAALPQL